MAGLDKTIIATATTTVKRNFRNDMSATPFLNIFVNSLYRVKD
jgi:hypothetical protein